MPGLLTFMRADSYENRLRGLNSEAVVGHALDVLSGVATDLPAANWAQVHRPLCRNGLFVLEASIPAWAALLRFDPADTSSGDYRVQHRQPPRLDTGSIESIIPFSSAVAESAPTTLEHHKVAFKVTTFSHHRGERLVWLVGINEYADINDLHANQSA